jgi:hypothetical protein
VREFFEAISKLSASDFAAWWGALVGTLALGWEVYVSLRSGPRVRVRANPNMLVFPRNPATADSLFLSVTAINRGTGPTTITLFCGYHFRSVWAVVTRRRQEFVIQSQPGLGQDLPHVLQPGEQWSGMADQAKLLKTCPGGYLCVGVLHNQAKHPVLARVRFSKSKKPAA